ALDRLEVVEVDDGAADPDILQLRPPDVEEVCAHPARRLVGHGPRDDLPFLHLRYVIRGDPALRAHLAPIVDASGLEGLELDGVVTVEVIADLVEIVEPPIYREVSRPVILDPLIGDRAPGLDLDDLVGAVAERRFQ